MMTPPLLSSERHTRILELLEQQGVVRHAELRSLLNVSAGTIRTDLRDLDSQGLLEVVHGGAVTRRWSEDSKLLIDERVKQHSDAKRRIGARAAQLVQSGHTIIVDSGSTTVEVVNALSPSVGALQIVTHGLNIAVAASRLPRAEILMPGGIVRSMTLNLIGPQVSTFMDRVHADLVFLATNGFSPEEGLTTTNLLEADIKRVIVERGQKVVLMADSSKYGKRQSLNVIPMTGIDILITDTQLSDSVTAQIEAMNIEVWRV